MPERTRPCPKCGGTMSLRLGEFQCGSCEHTEPAGPPPQEERQGGGRQPSQWESRASRGVRRASSTPPASSPWEHGPIQPPPVPPQPPPPGQLPLGQYGYSSWEAGYHDLYEGSAQPRRVGGLHTEKVVCFGIMAGLYALGIILLLVMIGWFYSMFQGELGAGEVAIGGLLWGSVLIAVIGAVVWLWLIWFALFGTQTTVKWGCMAWTALGSLGSIWTVLSPGPIMAGEAFGPEADVARGFAVVFALLNLAFSCWFISILYRDAQQMQQG